MSFFQKNNIDVEFSIKNKDTGLCDVCLAQVDKEPFWIKDCQASDEFSLLNHISKQKSIKDDFEKHFSLKVTN